ncbi:hypothetical protein AURDEDRAFT_173124 [Auricularia subglabra TFB-10046 SS5]|nr:hypothetical protein AURDEDRAFT_173124 [Auricularia subglabra TFB-10046 SS5]
MRVAQHEVIALHGCFVLNAVGPTDTLIVYVESRVLHSTTFSKFTDPLAALNTLFDALDQDCAPAMN